MNDKAKKTRDAAEAVVAIMVAKKGCKKKVRGSAVRVVV